MHRPPHQRGRCGGFPYCSRKLRLKDEVDGWEYQGICVMQREFSETRSRDIPVHILQMPLSGNFHQKVCCALQAEVPLFYL